jgi:carbamoyltransferase
MKKISANILGINLFHGDASAALVVDGNLTTAVEEERFSRIKHHAGFPSRSIDYVFNSSNIRLSDLDCIAISFNPLAHFPNRFFYGLNFLITQGNFGGRYKRLVESSNLSKLIRRLFHKDKKKCKFKLYHIEHHETHLASAFWPSPFGEAALLSVDGMGDFVSTVFGYGTGKSWRRLHQVSFPHSLGYLYNAITLYLGFPNYGDEYKVMGLAPYGEPRYLGVFREIIKRKGTGFELDLSYFTHSVKGIMMNWDNGSPVVEPFHSKKLEIQLGPPRKHDEELTERHQDIAASLQAVTEEIMIGMLRDLSKMTKSKNLCLSGGVAMNSVANGKIRENTEFENIFVPVGAADNGTAIGAAFCVWKKLGGERFFRLEHAYWGTDVNLNECREACRNAGVDYLDLDNDQINILIVDALLRGEVVGIFRGRMEFGARALGNRSLVADPRRQDMRDLINTKIKFREKFRPFAPSVLEEYASEFFENYEPSPFMEKVLRVKPDKRPLIPAVTHVDGTGRLQTVSRSTNKLYWELIELFRKKTGVPLILNTSLNENEPIVNTPQEALSCFLRTKMDALVLGSLWVSRKSA